jgi:hypothetical protein
VAVVSEVAVALRAPPMVLGMVALRGPPMVLGVVVLREAAGAAAVQALDNARKCGPRDARRSDDHSTRQRRTRSGMGRPHGMGP